MERRKKAISEADLLVIDQSLNLIDVLVTQCRDDGKNQVVWAAIENRCDYLDSLAVPSTEGVLLIRTYAAKLFGDGLDDGHGTEWAGWVYGGINRFRSDIQHIRERLQAPLKV